jgi:hypothetical protein
MTVRGFYASPSGRTEGFQTSVMENFYRESNQDYIKRRSCPHVNMRTIAHPKPSSDIRPALHHTKAPQPHPHSLFGLPAARPNTKRTFPVPTPPPSHHAQVGSRTPKGPRSGAGAAQRPLRRRAWWQARNRWGMRGSTGRGHNFHKIVLTALLDGPDCLLWGRECAKRPFVQLTSCLTAQRPSSPQARS